MAALEADSADIGQRARTIRRRRGLSLEVAAGLAGISTGFLSRLERGERNFERRGLLEDLAAALGCAVADLTGQPYPPVNRDSADAMAELPAISLALHECSLTDVPGGSARPVAELAARAMEATRYIDAARYALAWRGLGAVLTELHIHAVTGDADTRRAALFALAEACHAVPGQAAAFGRPELAVMAAGRAHEAATAAEAPAARALSTARRVTALLRISARHSAGTVLHAALADAEPSADPAAADTAPAEGYGVLHLTAAQLAAREGRATDADIHLTEARELAARMGERNYWRWHFGPANVEAWRVGIGVELERGPDIAESVDHSPEVFEALASANRRSGFHYELARAYAQDDSGSRDAEAIRHLDAADRVAPSRTRPDPIARELVETLARRARRRVWELDSLRNRFGVN